MKVKSEKKEKSQALGYILSLAAMAAWWHYLLPLC